MNKLVFHLLCLLLIAVAVCSCSTNQASAADLAQAKRQLESEQTLQPHTPFAPREFDPYLNGRWIGQAVSYGCYRQGQAPGVKGPNKAEILQDLQIIQRHWNLIRVYNADDDTQRILEVIHENKLPLKVMLGIWLENESNQPQAKASNIANILRGIELANAYPELIAAVNVGNETQVYWSGHRLDSKLLIKYLRTVRAHSNVPVTTADDYNFWNKTESLQVAEEIDFIVVHIYPLWNGKSLDNAIVWLDQTFREVQGVHPEKLVVLGEIGWATDYDPSKTGDGEQGTLIKTEVGLEAQERFLLALDGWVHNNQIVTFLFEAFDEPWKGGGEYTAAIEIEKNWGVFYVNRTPKMSFTSYLAKKER